jgi:hypothetical protein
MGFIELAEKSLTVSTVGDYWRKAPFYDLLCGKRIRGNFKRRRRIAHEQRKILGVLAIGKPSITA